MLNKYEFELLRLINEEHFKSQRNASEILKVSLGTINTTMKSLVDKYLASEEGVITVYGERALQPYKVDNAIIMAAGMSSRFAPLSFENPKGLLQVKGDVLIERQIEQLHEKGITDITLVLGYMKEKFFYLKQKYGVKIVINEDYYRYNNTSTLMLVLDELKNTYICSSDNYFAINVFNEYEYKATYPVQYHDTFESGEYYVTFNKQGLITDVVIGEGEYCMLGHVFFDKDFSARFKALLQVEYAKAETKTKLWEKVYVEHLDEFVMYAKEYLPTEILEFDSLCELQAFDPYYLNNTDSAIFHNIMRELNCELKDIKDIESIKAGLTNLSFKFTVNDQTYVYRHPGVGTEQYINRQSEAFAQEVAKEYKLDDSFITMDENEGWKLSTFIPDASTLDYNNKGQVSQSLKMIKVLHDAKIEGKFDFDIWAKTNDFIKQIKVKGRYDFKDFDKLYERMNKLYELTETDHYPKVLCHCDFYDPNILITKDDLYLIDWEYAGNDDPGVDIGTFIACSNYNFDEAMNVLDTYEGKTMSKDRKRHFIGYIALASYYWFIWAIFQESNGAAVGEYLFQWYDAAYKYGDVALEMYGA